MICPGNYGDFTGEFYDPPKENLPWVVLFNCGGTIGGTGPRGRTTGYTAATKSGRQLLDDTGVGHMLRGQVNIEIVELCQKDSVNINSVDLLAWGRAVLAALRAECVTGTGMLMGTDAQEEGALLLSIIINQIAMKLMKSVIMTGSIRPGTALSSDGPLSIFRTLKFASSQKNPGIYWLFGDKMRAASMVMKKSNCIDAFSSRLGNSSIFIVDDEPVAGIPHYDELPDYGILELENSLPRVDGVVAYLEADGVQVDACFGAGAQALVVGAMPGGHVPDTMEPSLRRWWNEGFPIVFATQVDGGFIKTVPLDYGIPGGPHTIRQSIMLTRVCQALGLKIEGTRKVFEYWKHT
ncbi:type II asparaginase [Paramyrothecium foliicola]|nr:type II asparaginase [Paramyrothecium foliicola]